MSGMATPHLDARSRWYWLHVDLCRTSSGCCRR
ncbi:hypothetical protein Rrhod_0373 [Rhodococcus rhodnii LMG 5362]|uniref:Uncharacterized protein n=1 Tax=Rhodococcus rhodnii LMG 5362 TaxID=1273125 RepID=R7WSJ8_9NOCA|nr:hypothetical protein Rrhod_0373 [Rhodococcus rhodnii LMG 5362]